MPAPRSHHAPYFSGEGGESLDDFLCEYKELANGYGLMLLPPRQAAKRPRCECDPSWFCSLHDACFIHESCLCEGSSKWPLVKPVRSHWVSESREWLAALLSRR